VGYAGLLRARSGGDAMAADAVGAVEATLTPAQREAGRRHAERLNSQP
jgi:hypothetical protein